MGPEALAQVLRPILERFPKSSFPDLLVGLSEGDDAAVYRLDENTSLIFTVDFFAPVVDDAYTYGAIAAANSMSDVYAMGGEVLIALNIACIPADMPPEIAGEIFRGGADKIAEAGGILVGGHTMDDKEPKYGLAVLGIAHPGEIVGKEGAKPGDLLVLTKPLGSGVITTALKGGLAEEGHVRKAIEVMKQLNRTASRLMREVKAHAATDITGFGLLGHAQELAARSGVRLRFFIEKVPLMPGAREYAEGWLFPGGTHSNERYYSRWVEFASRIDEETQLLLYDAQTSGGLLVAIPPEATERFLARCAEEAQDAWVVGEVIEGRPGTIEVI